MKTKVLFLSTTNSARSQMAEAFLRHYAGETYDAFSAGLAPSEVHPLTAEVMAEAGVPLDGAAVTHVADFLGRVHFGYIITVCSTAEAECPRTFMGVSRRLYWDIADPLKATGTPGEIIDAFRAARDAVQANVQAWLANPTAGTRLVDWQKAAPPAQA